MCLKQLFLVVVMIRIRVILTVIQKRNDEISNPIDSAKRDLEKTRYTLADIKRMKGYNGPSIVPKSCTAA